MIDYLSRMPCCLAETQRSLRWLLRIILPRHVVVLIPRTITRVLRYSVRCAPVTVTRFQLWTILQRPDRCTPAFRLRSRVPWSLLRSFAHSSGFLHAVMHKMTASSPWRAPIYPSRVLPTRQSQNYLQLTSFYRCAFPIKTHYRNSI